MTVRRDIDLLLPMLMTHAPKCPEPLAVRYLRQAAREFCRRTRLWRESDRITIDAPDFQGLCTIEDSAIVSIQTARFNGNDLKPVSPAWLDEHHNDWQSDDQPVGAARYITQTAPNTITIVPREEGTLQMRLCLQPSRDAFTFPAFLVEDHGDEIGMGAAGLVLTTPSLEIANPELGAALLQQFHGRIATTNVITAKGQQRARLRTKGSYL